jgi:tRNA (uracil-5-)-methyltransferase
VNASGLEPFNKSKIEGFWRIFLYRESSITNQALISFVVTDGTEVTAELKKKMVESFALPLNNRNVVSISIIYSSEISGAYKEGDRVEQLFGLGYYEEILCGIKFQIDAETTLLDICCGTGAIGLCLSQVGCKKVVGVELIKQAVDNANENV